MVATQAPHARQTTRVHLDRQRDARGRLQARARRCREHLSSSLHRCGYRVCCLIAYRKAPAAAPAARSPPACTRPARRAAAAADADAAARRAKTRLALHWKRHWQPQKTRAALYRSLRPRGGSTGAIRGIQGAGDSSGTVAASHLGTSTLCSAAARTQKQLHARPKPPLFPLGHFKAHKQSSRQLLPCSSRHSSRTGWRAFAPRWVLRACCSALLLLQGGGQCARATPNAVALAATPQLLTLPKTLETRNPNNPLRSRPAWRPAPRGAPQWLVSKQARRQGGVDRVCVSMLSRPLPTLALTPPPQ